MESAYKFNACISSLYEQAYIYIYTVVSRKKDYAQIPQFCLEFLLRSNCTFKSCKHCKWDISYSLRMQ